MKIVVLGPTGGTGDQIIRQALAAGHDVTVLARTPEAVTAVHEHVRVLKGDVLEPASLAGGVFAGAHAVLSALGSHSGRAPTYVYSDGMTNIRAAMVEAGVRRIIAISAIPVSQPSEKSMIDRLIAHPILYRIFGGSYDDLRRMEADLRGADEVDWTVFRAPRLLDGAAIGTWRTAIEKPLSGARDIKRADLAAAMLASIDDPTLIHKVVTIAR
jgi:putative NADH-flavin reductase